MAWLHTWTGLVVGWVLLFVFATGTAGYFYPEIDRWMRPELGPRALAQAPPEQQLRQAQRYLQARAPQAQEWTIHLQGSLRDQPGLTLWWRDPPRGAADRGGFHQVQLDPVSGAALPEPRVRDTGGGFLLYRMHYSLHYIPYEAAIRLVGACTMVMLVAIVSGVITHKKIFKDFFTFRPGKGQRSWLDAHNLLSVAALPFFLMITYSGLVFFLFVYMPAGLQAAYGGDREAYFRDVDGRAAAARAGSADLLPLEGFFARGAGRWGEGRVAGLSVRWPGAANAEVAVRRRADNGLLGAETLRFDGVDGSLLGEGYGRSGRPLGAARVVEAGLLNLHEGHFAGPWLRWGYFGSGLLGCAMIGTGLVLWTVKRRAREDARLRAGRRPAFGMRLVECLNIGTIAGLPTAIAAYFWANRLLPVELAGRAGFEVHALFATWGALLLYPAFRSARRAWPEELTLAAAAFGLLPLLNALTTDTHLGVTLAARDWGLAGFDLTALALGAAFALAARRLRRRAAQPAAQRAPTTGLSPTR